MRKLTMFLFSLLAFVGVVRAQVETILPEGVGVSAFGTNGVTDGTNFYATLQAAVEAVAGQANSTLYCKPGADVGSLQHAPVTATLTVYGNGAYVSGGSERDFDLGNTDLSGGKDITADMTLTVKNLDGCSAWGTKATEHTVNVVFENCKNMYKVYISGTTGTLNISMTDCAFEGAYKEALYSNADGNITLTNVAFSNLNKAVNLNHKATGTQTVTINSCSFTNCGADVAQDQIPVRVLSSVHGGKSVLSVSDCTFSGTPEGGADILLDYGKGVTEAAVASTSANVVVEKENNVGTTTTVASDNSYEFTTAMPVAKVGETEFMTLVKAIEAVADGGTVTLLADVELAEMVTFPAGKTATLDLNGKSISMEESIISTAYALQNLGNLTLKDGVGTGSINARGIYNGAENNTSAEMTVLSGTYNAKGTNGGAAIFNYAKAVLTGGTFTSVGGYSLNNRDGASMEIAQDVKATGGIYNIGAELTVNGANISNSRSGSHTIYAWSSAVIINDGTIHNNNAGNATVFADGTSTITIDGGKFSIANGKDIHGYGWTSCLIDARGSAAYTINDGEFKGHIRVQTGAEMTINGGTFENTHAEAYAIDGTVSVKGGTFTDDASKKFASTYLAEGYIIAENNGIYTVAQPVAKIGETKFASLQDALNAAASGVGEITVEILEDINLTGTTWAPVTVSGPGYPLVTVEGNEHTITGLTDMLFAATWAGKSGLIIKNLTIANSAIVNDENDANGNVGVGAFIGYPQASATITLDNCHLKNSSVKGGHWTGGLIGMAGGYNGADGPVFMNLTIKDCSVTGSTITGKGSAGGIIGHGSCAAWTKVVIENTTVTDNTILSTGSSVNKAGAVMGTIGAAGQPTTVNGVEKTGGAYVSAMVARNTVKSAETEITTIYGRQGTSTGMLYLVGGSYDKYPIEPDVIYAAVVDGYVLDKNADGTYSVVVKPTGTITPAYTSEATIWGEGGGNAKESFVVKLYSNETLLATSSLNNIGGIIDGDVNVTWNIPLNSAGNDEYWNVIWENNITSETMPTKVVLFIDDEMVAENNFQLNSPDDLNKIYAAVADVDGNFMHFYTSFATAATVANSDEPVIVLRDVNVSASIAIDKLVTIDLNGKAISSAEGYVFEVTGGELVLQGEGSIGAICYIINDADYKKADKTFALTENKINVDIVYNRTFGHTSWQVLYVPFAIPVENMEGFEVYSISDVTDSGVVIEQVVEGDLSANTPYIIKATEAGDKTINVTGATLSVPEPYTATYGNFTINGTYSSMAIDAESQYVLTNGKWCQLTEKAVTDGNNILGAFRVYLTANAENTPSEVRFVINNSDATAIDELKAENGNVKAEVYDLSGRRVEKAVKGIYVVNGKKVVK